MWPCLQPQSAYALKTQPWPGDMVQFMGDFEPFTPAPVVPGAVVELQMMLIGKGKTSNVTGAGQGTHGNGHLQMKDTLW